VGVVALDRAAAEMTSYTVLDRDDRDMATARGTPMAAVAAASAERHCQRESANRK